ncbi:MAG TPA: hypothetical protein VK017_15865 [Sphingobacterium sp.]|jgi:hypothetical protein|nr:hypothetical protein [Sphingobacterium sp.]
MKKLTLVILAICISLATYSQEKAAIRGVFTKESGDTTIIWMFADGYCSKTAYRDQTYISTLGGPFSYTAGNLAVQVEYADADSSLVGQRKNFPLTITATGAQEGDGISWKKADAKSQPLDGLWRITGRKQGDKMGTITRGDRKTIKLLVDGYFQWIAINPAVKGFYGTGGGHYTFQDGKYSEHILFFSRDNSRVGAHLSFDGKLEGGDWHHSGKSSKGDPIYEIWSRDNK